MKKFAFLFIHNDVVKTGRTFHVSLLTVRLLVAFCLVSFLTFIIFLYGFSQYATNRAAYFHELVKRGNLRNRLDAIQKNSVETDAAIRKLFRFDDNVRILYGIKPIPRDIREVGIGGPDLSAGEVPSGFLRLNREQEVRNLNVHLEKLLRQAEFEKSSLTEIDREIVMVKKRLRRFPSVLPAFGRLTSDFGLRLDPITRNPGYHYGIDVANRVWTPVYATADGIVKLMEANKEGFGNLIILDHGFGYCTLFAHLQDFMVKKDQFVMRGDLIGYIGVTGRTTGPHLHYEIRRYNKPVDPMECVHPMALGLE